MFCVTWIYSETEAFCLSWTQSERRDLEVVSAGFSCPHALRLLTWLWCYFVLARFTTHLDLCTLFLLGLAPDLFQASVELSRCVRSLFAVQITKDDQVLCHNILAPRKKACFKIVQIFMKANSVSNIKFHFVQKNSGNFTGNVTVISIKFGNS
jgi:hypothetical protein